MKVLKKIAMVTFLAVLVSGCSVNAGASGGSGGFGYGVGIGTGISF